MKLSYTQIVETSVTNNSNFQNYPHPDDHTIRTTDTPGSKPFTLHYLFSGKDDFASCAANTHVHCATQAQQDLENRVRMCSSTENLIKCYENPEEPYSAKIYTDFVNILQKFASQLRGGMPDC